MVNQNSLALGIPIDSIRSDFALATEGEAVKLLANGPLAFDGA
jgi:hypothetical protein